MDETTTSDSGATAQPQQDEAVKLESGDQVIGQDDNGTPAMQPVTDAPPESADEAASEEAQADDFDAEAYAKKKGIDLSKADPKTLVKMQYEAEKKMHEATEQAKQLETAAMQPLDFTGDPNHDDLADTVNQLLIQNNVRDFFTQNPDAREFETKMAEIVIERPHLKNDLDALYALARSDPQREASLKTEGGREALQTLAQKQQQIPPASGATNSAVYESTTITPSNVYDLVEKNDQEWFEKNHKTISRAMEGKS